MNANEIPWGWYAARSSGIVAFLLLYLVMFLGLAIRTPFLKKVIQPRYSYSVHCWLSVQALIFVFIHASSFFFDKFLGFRFKDIFIPFAVQSDYVNTTILAMGIIGFYLMIILIATSYLRRFIGQKLWRAFHFLNIVLYIFVVIHSFFLGTDLKKPIMVDIFIWLNAFLVFLILNNSAFRILGWDRSDNKEDKKLGNLE
jgi:methionine sulfoxide reductase heme-binding subunit